MLDRAVYCWSVVCLAVCVMGAVILVRGYIPGPPLGPSGMTDFDRYRLAAQVYFPEVVVRLESRVRRREAMNLMGENEARMASLERLHALREPPEAEIREELDEAHALVERVKALLGEEPPIPMEPDVQDWLEAPKPYWR